MNRVADLASRYYITGPSQEIGVVLLNAKPDELGEQMALLNRLAAQERRELEGVMKIRKKYDAQKAKLDALDRRPGGEGKAAGGEEEADRRRDQAAGEVAAGDRGQDDQLPDRQGRGQRRRADGHPDRLCTGGQAVRVGATGPNSSDCSGLTQYAYKAAGIYLTHFTGAQWNEGKAVSRSEARPGDLVFFRSDVSHVGLYLGNNQMVHAPRAGKPVNVSPITTMPIAGFRRPG